MKLVKSAKYVLQHKKTPRIMAQRLQRQHPIQNQPEKFSKSAALSTKAVKPQKTRIFYNFHFLSNSQAALQSAALANSR